jgi:hypothetical protein
MLFLDLKYTFARRYGITEIAKAIVAVVAIVAGLGSQI